MKIRSKEYFFNSNSEAKIMSWESDIFVCSLCGEQFSKDPEKLALHIRNKHESERGSIKKDS